MIIIAYGTMDGRVELAFKGREFIVWGKDIGLEAKNIVPDIFLTKYPVPSIIFQGIDHISYPFIKGKDMKEFGVCITLSKPVDFGF